MAEGIVFDLLMEFAKMGPDVEKAVRSSTSTLSPLHLDFAKLVNKARVEFDLGPIPVPKCPTYEGKPYKGGEQ